MPIKTEKYEQASAIWKAVCRELSGRSGFEGWWQDIKISTRAEIADHAVAAIATILEEAQIPQAIQEGDAIDWGKHPEKWAAYWRNKASELSIENQALRITLAEERGERARPRLAYRANPPAQFNHLVNWRKELRSWHRRPTYWISVGVAAGYCGLLSFNYRSGLTLLGALTLAAGFFVYGIIVGADEAGAWEELANKLDWHIGDLRRSLDSMRLSYESAMSQVRSMDGATSAGKKSGPPA